MTHRNRRAYSDTKDVEFSPFCGDVSRGGLTVVVQIYRLAGRNDWSLEVVDRNSFMTVWQQTFETDRAAYSAFVDTLEAEGIRSFSEHAVGWLH